LQVATRMVVLSTFGYSPASIPLFSHHRVCRVLPINTAPPPTSSTRSSLRSILHSICSCSTNHPPGEQTTGGKKDEEDDDQSHNLVVGHVCVGRVKLCVGSGDRTKCCLCVYWVDDGVLRRVRTVSWDVVGVSSE
jgi:hypothetical protein